MKLYIDDGNIEDIESIFKWGIFSGITTNPTILKKNTKEPLKLIELLLKKFKGDLFVQCVSRKSSEMIKEGRKLYALEPKRIILKIPFCESGIIAAQTLIRENIRVAITGVHSFSQVIISSVIKADYVAPYVNRMEDAGISIKTISKMETFLEKEKSKTQIIAASFKNINQLEEIASYNVPCITAPVNLYRKIFENALTEKAILTFEKDWNGMEKDQWVIDKR